MVKRIPLPSPRLFYVGGSVAVRCQKPLGFPVTLRPPTSRRAAPLAWRPMPAPPTLPLTTPAATCVAGSKACSNASEVGILVIGVVLFIIGAVPTASRAVTQVLTNKRAPSGGCRQIGIASARPAVAFGT